MASSFIRCVRGCATIEGNGWPEFQIAHGVLSEIEWA